MPEILCTHCGKIIAYDAERPLFCSQCGAKLESDIVGLQELLVKAAKEEDTAVKHEVLLQARQLFPDSFEVEKQLLYLGRMWERGGKPDFYRIPYWPLSVFETPKMFNKKQRAEMVYRFFENPELERVSALASDRSAFLDEYTEYMAREYVALFIKCATSNSTFLGFKRKPNDVMRRSAACVCTILKNIDKCEELDTEMKMRMEWAFTRGFGSVFESEKGDEYLKTLL